jgi:hypothetical protein
MTASKNLRWKIAGLVVMLLVGLALNPVQAAKADPGRYIELSKDRGITGDTLEIRGYGFPASEPVRLSMYDNTPGEAVFGYAYTRSDGSFRWLGALAKASYYNRGHGEEPGIWTAPIGKVTIYAFPVDTSPSIDAGAGHDFRITDNRYGPEVSEDLANFGLSTAYGSLWNRTDLDVANGKERRSWLWGPYNEGNGVTAVLEYYQEGINGWRWVMYFDKARMEITRPDRTVKSHEQRPYYITNGLLVSEMVTGKIQLGDAEHVEIGGAKIPASGDIDPRNFSPNYAEYAKLLKYNKNQAGSTLNEFIFWDGEVEIKSEFNKYGVKAAHFVPETQHYIASPFWNYLNSTGTVIQGGNRVNARLFEPVFYATGLPITEAFWTTTLVGGVEKDVLVQLFERRVLTYTPSNAPAYQVEMGNVGLQYLEWRYGE